MSIRDNLGGGITKAKLWDALQYSGLVTEDMSAEEMLAVLAARYPNELILLDNLTVNSAYTLKNSDKGGDTSSNTYTFKSGTGLNLKIGGNNGWHVYVLEPNFDVDGFSKLTFTVSKHTKYNDSQTSTTKIGISDVITGGSFKKYYQVPMATTGTYTIDISDVTGKCYFKVYAQVTGWSKEITLSDIRFT